MRTQAHSRTAEATAAIRAGHLLYDAPVLFEDPFALQLTSPLWRTVCRHRWLHWLVVRQLFGALRPVHGWILVRDLLTDLTLQRFVESGGGQFVILGAGFDSTALRRPPWLESVQIIEVDHPATQAVKLARIGRLAGRSLERDFSAIATDFESESLKDTLIRSVFDRARPALFAWQGVIYYLSERAIVDTLTSISLLAANGSELLFDFLLPDHALARSDAQVKSFARLFTARMGERYISFHTPGSITALLEQTGFEVIKIFLDEELQATYFAGRSDGLSAMRGFGIAHARKAG